MTTTAPPRPPRPTDAIDRKEVEALVEALFEEARQLARRRRRVRLAIVGSVILVGASALAVFERTAESQSSAPTPTSRSIVSEGKVKVVIAGTNDKYDVRDGSLAGRGTFKATGAVTDAGPVLAYRKVNAHGTLITLRFVAKGKKGTITYLVKVDTNVGNARWTISSGTGEYKGLHGKGTERENANYTVSTLTGTVSG
jgi:hypothetical protein